MHLQKHSQVCSGAVLLLLDFGFKRDEYVVEFIRLIDGECGYITLLCTYVELLSMLVLG